MDHQDCETVAMARFKALMRVPWFRGGGGTAAAALQELQQQLAAVVAAAGMEVDYSTSAGLSAQSQDRHSANGQKLVLSWGRAAEVGDGLAVTLELQSREAMACGAPATRRDFANLLAMLQEGLPELEVLQRSDHQPSRQGEGAAAVGAA